MRLHQLFQIKPLVFILLASLAGGTHALSDAKKQAISDRIKPAGTLCVEGQSCADAVTVAAATGEPRSGEEIYNNKCSACHTAGVAGAPKYGDKAAWADRLAKGIDALYQNAIQGINAMPPKGLCMDCSEDEIKSAVDYLTDK